jgi:hypothetical protein
VPIRTWPLGQRTVLFRTLNWPQPVPYFLSPNSQVIYSIFSSVHTISLSSLYLPLFFYGQWFSQWSPMGPFKSHFLYHLSFLHVLPPFWPGCDMPSLLLAPLPLPSPHLVPYWPGQGSALTNWCLYFKQITHMLLTALMMGAASTSEMLVNFHQTTYHYNPEYSHLDLWSLFLTDRNIYKENYSASVPNNCIKN